MAKKMATPAASVKNAQGVLSGASRKARIDAMERAAVAPSAPNANASARSQAAKAKPKQAKSTAQKVRDSFWES